jgi:hypothetical protein
MADVKEVAEAVELDCRTGISVAVGGGRGASGGHAVGADHRIGITVQRGVPEEAGGGGEGGDRKCDDDLGREKEDSASDPGRGGRKRHGKGGFGATEKGR